MNRQVIIDEDADNGVCFLVRDGEASGLFPFSQCTIIDVFADVLIHAFPVILTFDKMIGSVDSLVS